MSTTEIMLLAYSVLVTVAYFVTEYRRQKTMEDLLKTSQMLREADLMQALYSYLYEVEMQRRETFAAVARFVKVHPRWSLRELKLEDGKED